MLKSDEPFGFFIFCWYYIQGKGAYISMDFLDKLSLAGLVPVIAIHDAEDAVPLCKALADGRAKAC